MSVPMDPALRKAAEEGDVGGLINVLASNPDMVCSMTPNEHNTALHIVASNGHCVVVHHFLILTGGNVGLIISKNSDGDTPLHLAVREGHLQVVEHLIQYVAWARNTQKNLKELPLVIQNRKGNTLLHELAIHGMCNVAVKLLECAEEILITGGAVESMTGLLVEDTNEASIRMDDVLRILRNADRNTPFHLAVKTNHFDMADMLIKHDIEMKKRVIRNNAKMPNLAVMDSTLQKAADRGDVLTLIQLVASNPHTVYSVTPNELNTALHIAASHGHSWFVHHVLVYLNKNQELVVSENARGFTPYDLAMRGGYREVASHLTSYMQWATGIPKHIEMPKLYMDQELSMSAHTGDIDRLIELTAGTTSIFYLVTPRELNTVLHIAASKGEMWFVHHVLLCIGLDVEFIIRQNIDGDTPLHLAIREGHKAVVDQLIQYVEWASRVQPNIKELVIMLNKKDNTVLHEAVIQGMHSVVVSLRQCTKEVKWRTPKAMVKGYYEYADQDVQINAIPLIIRNTDGHTPLLLAVKSCSLELTKMLTSSSEVKNGELTKKCAKAPTIMVDSNGNTPLHEAVLNLMSDIALQLLDANPRCGHMLNAAMQSPFYIAIRDGLDHVVNKIAKQRLSVASISTHGTALHQSVLGDNIRALGILLDKYPELLELGDSEGNNALHYAAKTNNTRIVSMLLCRESTLAYKQNDERYTPLHVATKHGSLGAIKELLKHCPDVCEMDDIARRNVFHIAVMNNKVEVLKWLLRYVLQAEEMVNQRDQDGNTPLHLAAKKMLTGPALLLLEDCRVNPRLVNRDGETAFAITGKKELVEMSINELKLWKQLKNRESIRFKREWTAVQLHQQSETYNKSRTLYIFVATLMAMATFTATLTMPGRYNRQGFAIVGHHRAIKVFVVCNTISMCSSTAVILLFAAAWSDLVKFRLRSLIWANRLMILAVLTMILSMVMAVYVTVLQVSQWLAYTVLSIGLTTPFLVCVILGKKIILVLQLVDD